MTDLNGGMSVRVDAIARARRAEMRRCWPGLDPYVWTTASWIFVDLYEAPRRFNIQVQTSQASSRTLVYHSYGWGQIRPMSEYDGRVGLGWDGSRLIGDDSDWTVAMCDHGVPGVLRGLDLESVREDVERINSTVL